MSVSKTNIQVNDSSVFRRNTTKRILSIWEKNPESIQLEEDKLQKLVTNIEKSVFNFAIRESKVKKTISKWENPIFVNLYVSRLRSIVFNLEDNSELRHMLETGEIDIPTFGKMTHQEFQPDKWKEMIERKIMKNASKYEDNMQASTDMFTCKKCRSKRCTYYEMQTRSADEPSTIFITCLNCGKNWRQ